MVDIFSLFSRTRRNAHDEATLERVVRAEEELKDLFSVAVEFVLSLEAVKVYDRHLSVSFQQSHPGKQMWRPPWAGTPTLRPSRPYWS